MWFGIWRILTHAVGGNADSNPNAAVPGHRIIYLSLRLDFLDGCNKQRVSYPHFIPSVVYAMYQRIIDITKFSGATTLDRLTLPHTITTLLYCWSLQVLIGFLKLHQATQFRCKLEHPPGPHGGYLTIEKNGFEMRVRLFMPSLVLDYVLIRWAHSADFDTLTNCNSYGGPWVTYTIDRLSAM